MGSGKKIRTSCLPNNFGKLIVACRNIFQLKVVKSANHCLVGDFTLIQMENEALFEGKINPFNSTFHFFAIDKTGNTLSVKKILEILRQSDHGCP